MFSLRLAAIAACSLPGSLLAQGALATKVGPPSGTVVVVGGGSSGPEIMAEFIAAAGGPDALIIDVPNSGGAKSYDQNASGAQALRRAGAKNVYVLHTTDRSVADADSFVAIVKKAGGVWFDGGRQFHLVNDYAGTKTEAAFNDVLARGGVVGGSSAGASILGDFLVRGAPSSNNRIMDHPGYQKGFSYLRNVGVDQHVVARERLADLADSIVSRYPHLLGISEDEGTAWVIKGDTGRIIGRNKAFVYGGAENDPGSPFLTLRPGDTYNLATRSVIRRAIEGSSLTMDFVNTLFKKYDDPSAGGATVLVARNGEVLVNRSYGIPSQAKYMPTTTVPAFDIGTMAELLTTMCSQLPAPAARGGRAPDTTATTAGRGRGGPPPTPQQACVTRLSSPVGMQKTSATPEGAVMSNVDALYRLALGIENPSTYRNVDHTKGWESEKGGTRLAVYAAPDGKRSVFMRLPEHKASIIVLTNDAAADARKIATALADKLLSGSAGR